MSKPAGSSSGSSPCPGASCTAGACSRTMRSGSRSATGSTRTTRSTGSRCSPRVRSRSSRRCCATTGSARSGQTMATVDERLFQIFRHHDTIHAWLEAKGLLDVYQSNLLGWVISQMEWICPEDPARVATQVVRHLGADLRGVLADGDRHRAARGQQGSDGAAAERRGGQARVRQLRTHARQPARREQPSHHGRLPPEALRSAAHDGARRAVSPQPRAGKPGHPSRRAGSRASAASCARRT